MTSHLHRHSTRVEIGMWLCAHRSPAEAASAHAAMVKKAAALANTEMQLIPEDIGSAIVKACDDIIGGDLQDQFVVDMGYGSPTLGKHKCTC